MVKVKICGITNWEDAKRAMDLGASALGFNFFPASARYIQPDAARRIIRRMPKRVAAVGIFVNLPPRRLREVARGAGVTQLQLHGEEPTRYVAEFAAEWPVIKAFRVGPGFRMRRLRPYQEFVQAYLLDGYLSHKFGATGRTFDWKIARAAKKFGRIYVAGGLKPENVAKAILEVQPEFVDVASGVELKPGKKDPAKLRAFFSAVEAANRESRREAK